LSQYVNYGLSICKSLKITITQLEVT